MTLSRFRTVLPAAATFSKDPHAFWGDDENAKPNFLERGEGAIVTDTNGKKYIDWICALGANILGYDYKDFNDVVFEQAIKGASFSLPTRLEYEVAEKLVRILGINVPGWLPENLMVRFTKTGSECTEAAVRLARAVTGRSLILRCSDSYLGWGSTFIATTPPALGIPSYYAWNTVLFKYGQEPDTFLNDDKINELDHIPISTLGKPACVILEQGLAEPPKGWYSRLRSWCDQQECLLILDETASGFRYSLGGAAQAWDIRPDLATYGKALGNGIAISALVGFREYMEWFGRVSPVFVSGTFHGETLGLIAASYVLDVLSQDEEKCYDHLTSIGASLFTGLSRAFLDTQYKMVGHSVRSIIQWPSDKHHGYFVRAMARRGILINRPNYTTLSHTQEMVDKTVEAALDVIDHMTTERLGMITPEKEPRVLFRNR